MSLAVWVGIALLGGVGAVARFAVDWLVSLRFGWRFPLGILTVNLSGAFLLGLLVGASVEGDAYRLAGTAVLGSFTTFSTWMLDTRQLAERGRRTAALTNLALSLVIGLGAVALGHWIGSQI
jgi:fluoride exporter